MLILKMKERNRGEQSIVNRSPFAFQYYMSQIPEWRRSLHAMHQNVLGSLENDQVDYLDVRKCYAENLHLLSQWISSLYSR